MIHDNDHPILHFFLEREASMYQWRDDETRDTRRREFIERMYQSIITAGGYGPLNYVHIQSLSNMGLLTSELVLTAKEWGYGKSAYLYLPPSPRGGVSIDIREGK